MSELSAPPKSCPKCGAALPSAGTAGLCPRCLMAEAMVATQPDAEPAAHVRKSKTFGGVIGFNIGKNKDTPNEHAAEDYLACLRKAYPVADYVAVNLSSPNTPGLRDLQAVSKLGPLLSAVKATIERVCERDRKPALLVKIAPDLSDEDVEAVADLALELGLDGIVATNTTIARTGLRTPAEVVSAIGAGGLSGAPLHDRALAVLRRIRARVGDRLVVIAVGGVEYLLSTGRCVTSECSAFKKEKGEHQLLTFFVHS